jgi:hypothetical protein
MGGVGASRECAFRKHRAGVHAAPVLMHLAGVIVLANTDLGGVVGVLAIVDPNIPNGRVTSPVG